MRGRKYLWILVPSALVLSSCGVLKFATFITPTPLVIYETQEVEVTRIVEATRLVPQVTVVTVEVPELATPYPAVVAPQIAPTVAPVYTPLAVAVPGSSLTVPRSQHTATLLSDGRVLVVGGSKSGNEHLADVEIFDPYSGITINAAPLHTARHDHTATLLQDGRVMVASGYNANQGWLGDSEVYDPYSDEWTVIPMRSTHGVGHTATLLKDGRVLVVGGANGSQRGTDQVEIFVPQTNTWVNAMPLGVDRASHTAQLLYDGRVLIAGGQSVMGVPEPGDAMVYDPYNNTWSPTGPMVKPRIFATSVRLLDGRVLVAGGINLEDTVAGGAPRKVSSSVEIYDPTSNTWNATGDLLQGRYGHVMVLLQDGRVMVGGGARDWDCCWTSSSFVDDVEIYNPSIYLWSTALLLQLGANCAGLNLPDGRVWISGGRIGDGGLDYLTNTWLITTIP